MSSERIMNLLVTIPAESRRMNVGKDVIRILGSPAYICILQRKDCQQKKVIDLKDGMMSRKSNMDKSMLKSLHLPA